MFKRKTKTWSLQNMSINVQKKDQNLVITKYEHECSKERPKLGHYQNMSINV
jgi:hypothetical protein